MQQISKSDTEISVTPNGMRGCISYIAKRHSKANNKYTKCNDSSNEDKFIMQIINMVGQ